MQVQLALMFYNFIFMQEKRIKHLDLAELNYEEQSEGLSPRMQQQSTVSNLTPKMLENCDFVGQFEYLYLFQILQKSHSVRTHNENRFINEFIKKNAALKQLTDINGKQFCKGIMRTAMIEDYEQHEIIKEKGAETDTVFIILEGRVASLKNENETDMIEHIKQREVYEILMNASRKESKKINKLTRTFSSWRDYSHRLRQKYPLTGDQQFLENFQKGQTFGDKVRCFNKQFPHTFIALEKSLILTVDIKNVIFWLNRAFELKLEKLYKLLKHNPLFAHLDHEILEEIISFMSLHKRRKNELIYQQGQESTFIYFLEEGELKIQKECHLFVDNPNELYIDRRKLMNQREINNKEYLPYANFEHLYNYRPINKIIELGILTPFSLFGEEEIIEHKRRETTIRCSSLQAVFYSIEIKRIYQILNETVSVFLSAIKSSIKEKIRYRQASYASAMHLQNKNNLKYFYYQGEQALPTPRKYIIKKINEKICENCSTLDKDKAKDNSSFFSESSNDYSEINPQVKINLSPEGRELEGAIPPLYNTFNFHKMMKTRLVDDSLSKLALHDNDDQDEKIESNEFKLKFKQQMKKQRKIIADSHTWRLVKQKVKQEHKISKRIGSFKYDINFLTPLIDNKYFHEIQTEMKRIEREKKSGKFNVSTPRRRADSLNSILISK